VAIATDGPGRADAWRALSAPRLDAHAVREGTGEAVLAIPGQGSWPWFEVGERRVAGTFERGLVVWRARRTECAHDLLGELFGTEAPRWDPLVVCFLLPAAYEAYVRARHPDKEVADRKLRSGTFRANDGFAMRVRAVGQAIDFYSHAVGFFTGERLASPRTKGPDGKEVVDDDVYPWFHEGLGYLLSLELWGTADSHFFSRTESSAKRISPLPRPKPENRETLLAWVGQNLLAGRGLGLREVLTRSLNGLDFQASMEAWTFLRFLALLDPEAFRRLPAALTAEVEGARAVRADRALTATYGRNLDALEALWRAWLLEVV
jgi:hypothetical protein